MSNALTTKEPSAKELMATVNDRRAPAGSRANAVGKLLEGNRKQLQDALPKMFAPERFIRVVLTTLRKNPKLLDCEGSSLLQCVMDAAQLGLEIGNNVLGHAYLVPFKDECTLIPGYKGLISLVRRSGDISTIEMECVHEGDTFKYEKGDTPRILHIPNDADEERDSKPITHVYVVVSLKDGGKQRSVWTAAKIDSHKKKYAKAWQKPDSPWQKHWETMAKKTVLRDMVNRGLLPVSIEVQRLAMSDELHEQGMVLDATPTQPQTIADIAGSIDNEEISDAEAAAELFDKGNPDAEDA